MGRRSRAELHLALATAPEEALFAPAPFSPLDQRALYQSMRGLTLRVWRRLGEHWKRLPAAARRDAQALLDSQAAVLQGFQAVLGGTLTAGRMRCHDDLRQVLCTDGDVTLIDFAGVPARLLEERQLKRCPLYDVAGMLRSFHYAAYTMRWHQTGPPRTASRPAAARLEHWTRFWCAWGSAAFVRAYLALAPQMAYLPQTREELTVLCEVYLLEKAVHELGYELEHRLDWVRLPLRGLLQLLRLVA